MSSKYILKNNKIFTNSSKLLKDLVHGGRALVLSTADPIPSSLGKLSDFFDVVICESRSAFDAAGFADIVFYQDPSAYSESQFAMDWCAGVKDVIFSINYSAIRDLVKLKKDIGTFNINYVPDDVPVGTQEAGPAGASLSRGQVGVHLARIMGAKTVYSDYASSSSIFIGRDGLAQFMTEKDPSKFGAQFKNRLRASRQPILRSSL